MNFQRLRKAKLIAKKRFKYWYPDFDKLDWWRTSWSKFEKAAALGSLRKTNVKCSRDCCCNPRHSGYYSGQEKLTVQERKAPTAKEWGY